MKTSEPLRREDQRVPQDGVWAVHHWLEYGLKIESVHYTIRDAVAAADSFHEIGFLRWGAREPERVLPNNPTEG